MNAYKELLNRQTKFYTEEADFNVDFRIKALTKLSNAIKNNEDEIHKALKKDLRKSSFESFITETGIIRHEIAYIKKNLKKWTKKQKVPTSQKQLFYSKSYVQNNARGQVLIFSPWNYPFQLVMSPLIGAIAAGNTVVLKPSEHAPATSQIIKEIISELFPEKYIAVVLGDSKVAQALTELDWDLVFFTGSTSVGKKIYTQAAKHLTPVILELGGKCPVIVHKDANLKIAAKRIMWGKILNSGQTCVAPDYLLVHKSVKSKLMKLLCDEITEMLGKNKKESAAYARVVNRAHFERLTKLLENTDIICGGEKEENTLFISPTIIDNVQPSHPLMQEEIFGPILPVMEFRELDEAIRFISRQHPPLAIYGFTGSNKIFDRLQRHTRSGGIIKNDTLIYLSNLNLPFGGVRQSGIGRYHGKHSFDAFSEQRSILKHSTWFDPSVRYPPYTAKKWKMIKKIFG